ncbi:MAG: glutamate synthase subunit beta [Planctomycetota bacterium]
MAKARGFLEYKRQPVEYRPIENRVKDYKEIEIPLTPETITQQAARCADCGIPFCHGAGCPLGNLIPDFNELVYLGKWKEACDVLHSTNNLPEITGRICPAPCETACTLAVNDDPVLIRHIEFQIVERGFAEGWITPLTPDTKTGKTAAVIGSGPAGLAAAQQLARMGHSVTVFEKDDKPGGLLRYGIPDFKLEKWVIERRINQLESEGVKFHCSVNVGKDISANYLEKMFDSIVLTMGAGQPRDLPVEGRDLNGIHFAMEFLAQQNKMIAGETIPDTPINANGKHVIVIGGGDTGSDCVGTSRRQNAATVHQLEILSQPPETRPDDTPWPMWPRTMRTSSSHQEGCERMWNVMTKKFVGDNNVKEIMACKVEWTQQDGQWKMDEVPNSEFTLKADLVMLAMGFVHVEHGPLIKDIGIDLDDRGNVITDNWQTSNPKVFAAGDTVSGASLVVQAIDAGRKTADAVDQYLRCL